MSKNGTHNILTTLGTTNGSTKNREKDDFYSTEPIAVTLAVNKLKELYDTSTWKIWEPAVGKGHISNVLREEGLTVFKESDLIDRGINAEVQDFLTTENMCGTNVIFTNPPYKISEEFVRHFLKISQDGDMYIFLGRVQWLEGISRRKIFESNPPRYVLVHSKRVNCWKDGIDLGTSSAVAYAWFVFEKGDTGDTIVKWL